MVSAEENEKRSGRRGDEDQPVLRERIGVEQALPGGLVADSVLFGLIGTIQNGEVEVGGCVVDSHIAGIGAEELVRDQGRERERQRRVPSRVRLELKRHVSITWAREVRRANLHREPSGVRRRHLRGLGASSARAGTCSARCVHMASAPYRDSACSHCCSCRPRS